MNYPTQEWQKIVVDLCSSRLSQWVSELEICGDRVRDESPPHDFLSDRLSIDRSVPCPPARFINHSQASVQSLRLLMTSCSRMSRRMER